MALALLKFGNPVILDSQIEAPENWLQFIYSPWPIRWGYFFLGGLLLLSWGTWRWKLPAVKWAKWAVFLPLLWFGWQLVSATHTARDDLTGPTVLHFAGCLACFYLGFFALSRVRDLKLFWIPLVIGLTLVIWTGFRQHYGGLEQTRRAFTEMQKTRDEYKKILEAHPGITPEELQAKWDQYRKALSDPEISFEEIQQVYSEAIKLDTPEFQKKVASDRIFSTLVYPNALAGAIILLLPACLSALWNLSRGYSSLLRKLLVGLVAYGGFACLYWSQSKAGWLICLGMLILGFLQLPVPGKAKWIVVLAIAGLGVVGFFARHAVYFSKGATSAVARMDYWHAAGQLAWEKPFLGTGPGTFMLGYRRLKNPESEMTRLVHNDYLQQACDSGLPGFLFYAAFIWGSVGLLYNVTRLKLVHAAPPLAAVSLISRSASKREGQSTETDVQPVTVPLYDQVWPDWMSFAVWLGVAGLAAQSLVEFGLYIPAIAWPFFLFVGWLWGRQRAPEN